MRKMRLWRERSKNEEATEVNLAELNRLVEVSLVEEGSYRVLTIDPG